MSGPKHLWSGDWERESDQSSASEQPRPATPAPVAAVDAEPQRSLLQRIGVKEFAAGAAAALVVAGVAVALVVGLSGSSKPASPRPAAVTSRPSAPSAQPQPGSSNPSGGVALGNSTSVPTAYWLGMQILSTPLGAVVNTVELGSAGDRDGFYPGDAITGINNTPVNSVAQLRAALAKLPLGQAISVTVSRGSGSTLSEDVKLTKRPTDKP